MKKQPITKTEPKATVKVKVKRVKTPEQILSEQNKKEYQKYLKSKWFKSIREIVLDRDNHRCRTCNAPESERTLNVHHTQYEGVLGNEYEHLDKLITMCSVCHLAIHKAPQNYRRFSFAGIDLNNEKFKKAMQT